jgi:hypothetical protein
MYAVLVRRGGGLGGQGLERLLVRCLVACAAAALVWWLGGTLLGPPPAGSLANLVWLAFVGGAMAVATVGVLAAVRTPELLALGSALRRRFGDAA